MDDKHTRDVGCEANHMQIPERSILYVDFAANLIYFIKKSGQTLEKNTVCAKIALICSMNAAECLDIFEDKVNSRRFERDRFSV